MLCLSVLYQGRTLPVAWAIGLAPQKGAWRPHGEAWLDRLQGRLPADGTVRVCADRGLDAKWLFERMVQQGWHPFGRINAQGGYRQVGQATYHRLASVVPPAGTSWCGRVVGFKGRPQECPLLAYWGVGQSEAWLIGTDLPPAGVWVPWDARRAGIESGFSDWKRRGWQWHRAQMKDASRAERLALAILWGVRWCGVGRRRVWVGVRV